MALEMMKEGQIWELVCRQKGMGFLEAWVWGFFDRLSEITAQEISSLGGTFISLVKKKWDYGWEFLVWRAKGTINLIDGETLWPVRFLEIEMHQMIDIVMCSMLLVFFFHVKYKKLFLVGRVDYLSHFYI